MKKQNIEDIFSSLEDFSSVPPPELWGQIEEKLDKPKKKKRAILWWSAAACLLLGLGLPSVLHFNAASGVKINTNALENNSVVFDKGNGNTKTNKIIPSERNTIEKSNDSNVSPKDNLKNESNADKIQETVIANTDTENKTQNGKLNSKADSDKNLNQETRIAVSDSEKKNPKSDSDKNQNQETRIAVSDSEKKNQNSKLNSKSNSDKNQNQETRIAASDSEKENQNGNVKSNSDRIITNQKDAANRFVSNEENSFKTASKNKTSKNGKETAKQIAAQNSFNSGKPNAFNAAEKNQILAAEKRNADKILAAKTFNSGKRNGFNSVSKNQVPNSVFNDPLNGNNNKSSNNNFAFNSASNSVLNGTQNTANENKAKQKDPFSAEMNVAAIQKNNSKTASSLTKIDSVQLVQLQNLEKGIAAVETKKEKENKSVSKSEKWTVEVFAGVANSENTRNEKTLGNVNDSKQSSSYGVKTKYKINTKWAVGSGFKINELGQSVANVSYISAKNNAFFTPSDYFAQNSSVPQIASDASYVLVSNNTKNSLKSDNIESGSLDQNLRYFEMPLEVSYSLFNKNKTNISLNTGGFVGKLISNNVALDGTPIGKNLNANDFVYGSTLSSTVQYRIYKKTSIFAEPAINYYINPLSNQSFNQFQWGLNFGLNVSF